MPHLTIILPVHNGASTIERAVRSTLRAMPKDSELLVVDDASTDGSAELVDHVSDRRVRIVVGEGRGISVALNRGLASSDSALVGRMDADDVTLPWRFHLQVPTVSGARSASFMTVVDWTPARNRFAFNAPVAISPDAFGLHLTVTNPVSHPTMMCTRELLTAVGGYRSVPAEDYDLWIRMKLAGGDIRRLASPGLLYRLHPEQITASTHWRSSSWNDPLIGEEYRRLTSELIGQPFDRLNFLATSPTIAQAQFDRTLEDFESLLRVSAQRLRPVERGFLLRKATSRLTAARALRTSAAPKA